MTIWIVERKYKDGDWTPFTFYLCRKDARWHAGLENKYNNLIGYGVKLRVTKYSPTLNR
jgi:hypothetical protein